MKTFDTRTYSVSDFLEWRDRQQLNLSPEFQRRAVWSGKAKSYLVDTVIRGKPMPKIIITQELEDRKTIRVVVDGQQRLRAILDFIDGHFKISRAHNKAFAGKTFDDLDPNSRNAFLKYELGVDVLYDVPYGELLDIFARINTYTVKLNPQENLNAKYLGYFKQHAFELGFQFATFFVEAGVLTKAQISRMAEAKLASDLLVSLVDGVQTNKNVEQFYKKYEDELGPLESASEQFSSCMSVLGEVYPPQDLKVTNWSRVHLFYSLFTSIAHSLFGLSGLDEQYARVGIDRKKTGRIRTKLDDLSARYDEYTAKNFEGKVPDDFAEFIDASRRRTTDTFARRLRANFICKYLH